MASSIRTAASEVRPHTGEFISIAEFSLEEGLKLVDLRNPRNLITPFYCQDESEIAALRSDIGFLERLGEELTRPVLPRSAAIDYIPSQYLCELIKNNGYDGVIYQSSIGDEINIALFYPNKSTALRVIPHKVREVTVDIIKC
ncbi:RES family NAD+ phosphorylase [Pseudomonas sp. WAC2]|uniref:RES family NAD+ phosphorylase n=1 Tax=Pseudomonas sp. WAC2 TaxID=3055057 RepID=UPI0025B17AAB|nr:RES family NAD+ phosphorylase [Pseudomonas sp. WAC2]MDN3236072.1 RES family NAD+ phosphorylase [Pseudomonas sp. WAC2]